MTMFSSNEPQAQSQKVEVKSGGILTRIDSGLSTANRFMVYIAAVGLFGMMIVVVIDVIGRYAFKHPLMGAYELVGYLMAIAGPWAIGYSQVQKGHIRVDFILKRFPNKGQAVITSIAYLIGCSRLFPAVLVHDNQSAVFHEPYAWQHHRYHGDSHCPLCYHGGHRPGDAGAGPPF
jgi:hypothetical protein